MAQAPEIERPVLSSVEGLIPHRPPFRFVDALVSVAQDEGEFALKLDDNDARVRDGFLSPIFLVEALTQSAAAFHGLHSGGKAESGMLVEIDSARLHAGARAGDEVRLQLSRQRTFGPLARFHGRAWARGTLLVEAVFTVKRAVEGAR